MKPLFFEEDVDSVDCQKDLFNCLKKLEQKNKHLNMLANSNKEMEIKGEKILLI